MKKYIFMAAAAMAALSSCNDNEIIENAIPGNEIAKQPLVFTATMEGAPQTRATFDNMFKCAAWEVNDQISINGNTFFAGSAGTNTTFTAPVSQEIRPEYVHSNSESGMGNPSLLVDEDGTETSWEGYDFERNGDTWDIVVSTESPIQLSAIKLWNGFDNEWYSNQLWNYVKVYGSTSEWDEFTEIKTFSVSDGTLSLEANNGGLAGTLEVNATEEYQYYKIEAATAENDVMKMSDMKFVYGGGSRDLSMDDAPFHAYFPAYLYDGTTATLPANINEEWADGRFNMPMYAESATTDLQFKNLCGVLKITVKSDDLASVQSIKVSSSNCATSGAFTINAEGAAVLSNPTDASKTLTVNYTTPVETSAEGKVFYVAIPAQTYQDLKIKISDGVNDKFMVTKSGTDIVVERNKIYSIDFGSNHEATLYRGTKSATIGGGDVDVPWVQLWADGPKFAAYNVGVTDANPASYGGYYTWGGTIDKDPACNYYTGSDLTLPEDYDTATQLWGSNWRMPSKDELQGLLDNCDVEKNIQIGSHTCFKFTGRGAYSDYSLLLPMAGRGYYSPVSGWEVSADCNDVESNWGGFYWTNLSYGNDYNYHCLHLSNSWSGMALDQGYRAIPVRAVVKE